MLLCVSGSWYCVESLNRQPRRGTGLPTPRVSVSSFDRRIGPPRLITESLQLPRRYNVSPSVRSSPLGVWVNKSN